MTRAEHLAWCKERALEYVPSDLSSAVASMLSDMNKHSETELTGGREMLGMLGLMELKNGPDAVRRWITGFN